MNQSVSTPQPLLIWSRAIAAALGSALAAGAASSALPVILIAAVIGGAAMFLLETQPD
ncbi:MULTISPECIES: hypothetical protein [Hyphobacterium]|uniref:HPP family protein n=1 Tax=Hyphobacterium vulgare TaxID=1736751 RepID=A0ABV6ZZK4_9PROT